MSYPASKTTGTTSSNAWTLLSYTSPSTGFSGTTVRPYSTNTASICWARVVKGGTAPTSTPWTGDESDVFIIQVAGDNPYPMGPLADWEADLYYCALNGSAGQKVACWQEVG
jgi:hypothetical protein